MEEPECVCGNEFLACSFISEFGSYSRSVAVTFHYAYRSHVFLALTITVRSKLYPLRFRFRYYPDRILISSH